MKLFEIFHGTNSKLYCLKTLKHKLKIFLMSTILVLFILVKFVPPLLHMQLKNPTHV